jgi:CheY-like chemotaxis protein
VVCLDSGRPDARTAKPLSGVHVVIVDDERDVRELFTDVLQFAGAHVRAASSAREALTLIEAQLPHVVVSDVMMPHEDGYWLIASIRAMGPRRPRTLAITGDAQQHSRDEMLRAGYDAHLTKPIGVDTLVAAVARLAGRPR